MPICSHLRFLLTALAFLLILPGRAVAQHTFTAIVLDAHEEEPLPGVSVVLQGSAQGAITDAEGRVHLSGIPAGEQALAFTSVGYEPVRQVYTFPLPDPDQPRVIYLEEADEELEAVEVTATRTSRTIADIPTRVETIAGEEIGEKINMDPSSISMLLNESPGVTVQQTSAVSGNAGIRIQGLDGRYTQVLKDGFPLYGGFSGGLSILQVPPLDLAQVEIIKGPSSTLYGGDAIAGLVNLVSRKPTEDPELSLLVNGTSAGGFDAGGFYQGRGERFGATVLATGSLQRAYDPDDDAFSNLPRTRRLTLNPKLFYYPSERTTAWIGLSATFEDREGGDVFVLENGPDAGRTFFEHNRSERLTSQARLDHRIAGSGLLTLRNSFSLFDRRVEVPGYDFSGRQLASYTEASYLASMEDHDVVLGLDLRTDAFRERDVASADARDYTYTSAGAFVQDTWDVSERFALEAGLRTDYHDAFGLFALPKVSLLYRATERLSARIGGGRGYKAPTVFLEPSEERAFRGVAPLDPDIEAETSAGGSVDVNYEALLFDRLGVSLNQAFYFTRLSNPLVPDFEALEAGILEYRNAEGHIQTRALETNVKLSLNDFKLFLGYVNLQARTDYDGEQKPLPLTPRHKTYTVLVYERHGKGRIGLEGYYTGPQRLTDGARTDGYWIAGVMAERAFGPARLFLNFENILDTKQSNYAPVVLGSRGNPSFAEIWAPMDGFVVNGGVKYTF